MDDTEKHHYQIAAAMTTTMSGISHARVGGLAGAGGPVGTGPLAMLCMSFGSLNELTGSPSGC